MGKTSYKPELGHPSSVTGERKVYILVTVDRVPKRIPLDLYVFDYGWDAEQLRSKPNKKKGYTQDDAEADNFVIEDALTKVRNILREGKNRGVRLSASEIVKRYDTYEMREDVISFIKHQKKLFEESGTRSEGTLKNYASLITHLSKFRKELYFYQCNIPLLMEFDRFLKSSGTRNVNTVSKNHNVFQFFLGLACDQEILEKNPYEKFKIQTIKGDREYLNPDEVSQLVDLFFSGDLPDFLQDDLRRFLFSCFTGLRISDSMELDASDIRNDTVKYNVQKLKNYVRVVKVPLAELALLMIDRNSRFGLVFKRKTPLVINRNLKTIMKVAGIEKHITFHCSRHTFATLYYRQSRDIVSMMDIMGITKVDTAMIYVHLVEAEKYEGLHKLNDSFRELMNKISRIEAKFERVA